MVRLRIEMAGRVTLNVGGTHMTTAMSTLEARSSYFRSMFARWAGEDEEQRMLFLDCDVDAFRVLLSYMRSGVVLLPRGDVDLCCRVLLQAEFLGMDAFLAEVKSVAWTNARPARGGGGRKGGSSGADAASSSREGMSEEARQAEDAAAFDGQYGGTQAGSDKAAAGSLGTRPSERWRGLGRPQQTGAPERTR